MGLFDNWPYSDVHQLNLDWMLKAVKEVKDKTDEIDAAVETSTENAESALESAISAANNASSATETLNTIRQEIDYWEQDTSTIRSQVATNTENIAVDSARIDAIISGTTPDANAELIDIRVNYDGATSPTAGDAVRTQVSDLHTEVDLITEKSKNILPIKANTVAVLGTTASYANGIIEVTGTATGSGGRVTRVINPFILPAGVYTLSFDTITGTISGIFLEKAADNTVITNIAPNVRIGHFTLNAETSVYLGVNVTSGETYDFSGQIQLENGSTKTDFVYPSDVSANDKQARSLLQPLTSRFWAYSIWKTLCIGDSLTSGAYFDDEFQGNDIAQNYPTILGRMLNAEVTNAGFSGFSASTWYNNRINNYNYSNYDTVIIWLGTNNGLTDTMDTDVNPYTDYHDFANTETGYYCKIIEAIKEQNDNCLIILTKVFASKGNVATTNNVIDQIATKYNLPVIDNSDLTVLNYPELHLNINNPHFGKAGNLFVANRYINNMGEWFADDPLRTEYGCTPKI